MIWHYLEVWLLLVAAFVIGCAAGASLRWALARTGVASLQDEAADAIAAAIGRLRARIVPWPPATRGGPALVRSRAPGRRASPGLAPAAAARAPAPALAGEAPPVAPGEAAEGPVDGWAGLPASRPMVLDGPRNGVADDLQRIRGIGRKNEAILNGLGIFHFGQIAAWTPAEARWVAERMPFPERLFRDDWIGQATALASGQDPGRRSLGPPSDQPAAWEDG